MSERQVQALIDRAASEIADSLTDQLNDELDALREQLFSMPSAQEARELLVRVDQLLDPVNAWRLWPKTSSVH